MTRTTLTNRILRVLRETGARKPSVFRGLAQSAAEYEQAIGQLFLLGAVKWNGRGKARVLQARSPL
jgi:hypothetical protein